MDATDIRAVSKLQQQLEELCSATVRATSKQYSFRFNAQRPEVGNLLTPIRAPHLRPDFVKDDFRSFRGAADGIALRLKHSDMALHLQLQPAEPQGQLLFEILEQLRCESLVSDLTLGTKHNLEHRFRQWCKEFHASNSLDSLLGVLIFTVVQVVWCRLTRLTMNPQSETIVEPMRMMLAPHIGTSLVGLQKSTHHQRSFAKYAQVIIDVLASFKNQENNQSAKQTISTANNNAFNLSLTDLSTLECELPSLTKHSFSNDSNNGHAHSPALRQYKIYTSKHDQIIYGEKLVPLSQRQALAEAQSKLLKEQSINIPKLAREFAKILPGTELKDWDFARDAGYIDGAKLSQLISSPHYHSIFRTAQQQPSTDAVVSFLLDNSGSMKAHIEVVSRLIQTICQALEKIGARSEVLGFTTTSWQGGHSYRQWLRKMRPQHPGRLCDTRHIIYKDANSSLHCAKPSLAAMLKLDLFREGIDGEALLWAAKRLRLRQEQRKILIVLTDGSPMQSTTNYANRDNYLDTHLRQAASAIENTGHIELYALGFGLDLSPYYRHSLAIETVDKINPALFSQILKMLTLKR